MKKIKFRIYFITLVHLAGHGPEWYENLIDSVIDKMEEWGWDDGVKKQHCEIIKAFTDAMEEHNK